MGQDNVRSYFRMLKWKFYLWGLWLRQWFNDLMIDWYFRGYLHEDRKFMISTEFFVC